MFFPIITLKAMLKHRVAIVFLYTIFLHACSEIDKNYENSLPPARGEAGEIVLVMDSTDWKGKIGDELRQAFRAEAPGLPQDEPLFTLRYVDPGKLNSVLRSAKNMIFVTTMEGKSLANRQLKSYFTKESLEKIENNPDLFMLAKKNEYARGQEVLHLFGQNDDILVKNIRENRDQLRNFFNEVEKKRLISSLYKSKEKKGVTKNLLKEHEFSIRVPFGYDVAKNEENFVWLRQLSGDVQKNIFFAYTEYNSESLFSPDSILDLRENVAEKYIWDKDDKSLFLTTQRIVPLDTTTVNFNGKYAIEARGLWKLSDNSLGGPFISYTFVDENLNRLYYIEGFVAAPGKDKREFMREMEAILSTFETRSEQES